MISDKIFRISHTLRLSSTHTRSIIDMSLFYLCIHITLKGKKSTCFHSWVMGLLTAIVGINSLGITTSYQWYSCLKKNTLSAMPTIDQHVCICNDGLFHAFCICYLWTVVWTKISQLLLFFLIWCSEGHTEICSGSERGLALNLSFKSWMNPVKCFLLSGTIMVKLDLFLVIQFNIF